MTESAIRVVSVVVIHEDGRRILLHKREDFRIWSLPGGFVEAYETQKHAAVRETLEETGYEIHVDGFVGEYYRPQFRTIRCIYRGYVVGGEPIERGAETLEVGWFYPDELPFRISPSVREVINDALNQGIQPVRKEERFSVWKFWTMRMLIGLRDLRNKLQGRV